MNIYTLVALITFFFSFGVQSLWFCWYKYKEDEIIKDHKHVFNYLSGVVGDALLIPLINVFAVSSLLEQSSLNHGLVGVSFLGGIAVTTGFHLIQLKLSLTNWTMPEVGKWTNLGIYHALFMFFETSLLILTLLNFVQNIVISKNTVLLLPILQGLLVLFVFLLTMIYDYRKEFLEKILNRSTR